jgi:hypothetical protein
VRYRGLAYPYPLAYALLDTWNGQVRADLVPDWDRLRRHRGIPSIFG